MNATRHRLPEDARGRLIKVLNARLADMLDLKAQTKQAHWNVRGQTFIALHELFDKLAGELDGWADDIAERAIQFGGPARGSLRDVVGASAFTELPADTTDWRRWVDHLATLYGKSGTALAASIKEAEAVGDAGTADLFTGISQGVDKALWFLEAHL